MIHSQEKCHKKCQNTLTAIIHERYEINDKSSSPSQQMNGPQRTACLAKG